MIDNFINIFKNYTFIYSLNYLFADYTLNKYNYSFHGYCKPWFLKVVHDTILNSALLSQDYS